jgi:hypothetical protein
MKLWKSLLVGFGSYIVLTFLGSLATAWATIGMGYFSLDIWAIITTCFTGQDGFAFVGPEVYNGMLYAVLYLPSATDYTIYVATAIMILVPILPGLVAAILTGKIGKTSANGFFGMLITGILITVYPIIMIFVNPTAVINYIPFVGIFPSWMSAIFTGVIGLFIGAFWGGLAAFFGRE